MSSGAAALDAFIARVEGLRTMNPDVATKAEPAVASIARSTAAAGEAPSGEAWAPKADGGKALQGAAGAIESSTNGTKIELRLGAPYVFHNHGAGGSSTTREAERHRQRTAARQAKTGTSSKFHAPKRQIIPGAGEPVPEKMKAAIADAAAAVFGKAVG